ncbi:hypothetical protein D3C72_1517990 [compost metagenome]
MIVLASGEAESRVSNLTTELKTVAPSITDNDFHLRISTISAFKIAPILFATIILASKTPSDGTVGTAGVEAGVPVIKPIVPSFSPSLDPLT